MGLENECIGNQSGVHPKNRATPIVNYEYDEETVWTYEVFGRQQFFDDRRWPIIVFEFGRSF